MTTYLKEFIECHEGVLNRIIHIAGLGIIVWGIFEKSVSLVILGALIQEGGHFYQYWKTGDKKYSPWFCFKPQLFFAYPLFILIILYIIFTR